MRETHRASFFHRCQWSMGLAAASSSLAALAAAAPGPSIVTEASISIEAMQAVQKLRVAPGLRATVYASEPLLENPVSFTFDEQGRAYVVETGRRRTSVYDIRNHASWLDEDLSFLTVEDRLNFFKKVLVPGNTGLPSRVVRDLNGDGKIDITDLEVETERIRVLEDRNHDGRADISTIFADGFNTPVSGVAAGILARKGDVYFTCIPDLWLLRDANQDRRAEFRKALLHGFGVHISFGGHDLHGLKIGPDGKLYFSIADRGLSVETEGRVHSYPHSGAIMRCNLDGSEFEIYATGLRNPQELAFDQFGNLWTGDNNGDGGDKARWVFALEGSDSGWHLGWQHLPKMGPWNSEKLWELHEASTAAYILPPVAHIGHGPAGLAFYPGTGLPRAYDNHFLMCDFPGGVRSFALEPKGAAYQVVNLKEFLWDLYPVDVEFGVDGGAYVADWIQGWEKTGKGRIFRVFDPNQLLEPELLETRDIFTKGMAQRSVRELGRLLGHRDMRIRQEAQFALVDRGLEATNVLAQTALAPGQQLARLHAIWGLGQMGRTNAAALDMILPLASDQDAEVRAQFAKVMGENHHEEAASFVQSLLHDPSPRVRLLAALAIGKLGAPETAPSIIALARSNQDPYIRHAIAMALVWLRDEDALAAAAKDESEGARMAALLAMRHESRPEIAQFLYDSSPALVLEAARAVNDLPLTNATSQLASLIKKPGLAPPVARRVLNANFRLGRLENALAAAEYAARTNAPAELRAEALRFLGQWASPPRRDAIVGLWRPLPARDSRGAALALRTELPRLIQSPDALVSIEAMRAGALLGISESAPLLRESAMNLSATPEARAEALRGLSVFKDSKLAELLAAASGDTNEAVRKEVTALRAAAQPHDAAALLKETLEKGSLAEKQAALAAVSNAENPALDEALILLMSDLNAGRLDPGLHLDTLEAAAKRSSPRLKARLKEHEFAYPKSDALGPFRETLMGGSIDAGRKVFVEKAEAACLRCHKAEGEGGEVGPDLAGIGAKQTREYLLESILFPNHKIAPGYASIVVTLKNGTAYAGIVKSETASELVLNSPEDGLVSLNISDIAARQAGLSAMPGEMGAILTKRELRDLIEYLASLK